MGLKEKAIAIYLKETEEQRERDKKAAEEYARQAKKEFREIFGEEPDEVQPITQWQCEIHCDSLIFEVHRKTYGSEFYVNLPCSRCGKQVPIHIYSISSLGYWLSQKLLCERCSEKEELWTIIRRFKRIINLRRNE